MGCVDALLASRALFDAANDPHITHNSIPQGFTRFLVCIALVCGHTCSEVGNSITTVRSLKPWSRTSSAAPRTKHLPPAAATVGAANCAYAASLDGSFVSRYAPTQYPLGLCRGLPGMSECANAVDRSPELPCRQARSPYKLSMKSPQG